MREKPEAEGEQKIFSHTDNFIIVTEESLATLNVVN